MRSYLLAMRIARALEPSQLNRTHWTNQRNDLSFQSRKRDGWKDRAKPITVGCTVVLSPWLCP